MKHEKFLLTRWSTDPADSYVLENSLTATNVMSYGNKVQIRGDATRMLDIALGGGTRTLWVGVFIRCNSSQRYARFQLNDGGTEKLKWYFKPSDSQEVVFCGVGTGFIPGIDDSASFMLAHLDFGVGTGGGVKAMDHAAAE